MILITGATGWLGRGLLNTLLFGGAEFPGLRSIKERKPIRVFTLPGQWKSLPNDVINSIEIVEGDIRSHADCDKFFLNSHGALLFHTAGVIHPRKVADFYSINQHGTKKLLEGAERHGICRAVVVSSNSPIGCNPSINDVFDESSPFAPYMAYGNSKMLMEKEVIKFQDNGKIETVRVRAPWFYGPFQPERQSLFFKMIRDGKVPVVGSGLNKRSMVYIDNLVQGLLLAAVVPVANGKVYWIADDRPYSMNEIIDTIESVMETSFNIKCARKRLILPSFISDISELVDRAFQSIGIYHQKIHVLSEMNKTIACRVDLAKQELGYCPAIELREGIRRSLAWLVAVKGGL